MSEPQVDLSAIRGDWRFHMNYVSNAVSRTLTRGMKDWKTLGGKSPHKELDQRVKQLAAVWKGIAADTDRKSTIRIGAPAISEFIAACRATKAPCDAWETKAKGPSLATVKEFAEACRQLRSLCDDLEMMREQKPDDI